MSDRKYVWNTIQNAVAATGNGTALPVTSPDGPFSTFVAQVTGTFTATVTFEATLGESATQASNTWVAIPMRLVTTGAVATTATAAGVYRGNVSGYRYVRARVTWSSGTSVTVLATLTCGDVDDALLSTGILGTVAVSSLPDTRESWRVSTLSFTTDDDSSETWTVGANTEYQVLSIYISMTTSGDAGNRQMVVQGLTSGDAVLFEVVAGAVQAASTTYRYQFGPGANDLTAVRDSTYLSVAMPPLFLSAGQKLKVFDKAAIAAGADDMDVYVQIASRSVA